jgi:phage gp16-like protein
MKIVDPDQKRRDLAAIHIAAKQLGMDREVYEAMLFTVARVRSAGDLDWTGRQRVLARLRALGFKPGKPSKPRPSEWAWVDQASPDRKPLLRKIIMQLKSAGRGKAYAEGIARQMFHVERLEFCSPDQLHAIVAALNKDAARTKGRGV